MWFVAAGVVLLLLKLVGPAFFGQLPWWLVLAPFGLAVAWWAFADQVGITQRKAMQQQDERARKRRDRQYEEMGMRVPRSGTSGSASASGAAGRQAPK